LNEKRRVDYLVSLGDPEFGEKLLMITSFHSVILSLGRNSHDYLVSLGDPEFGEKLP
jgi:hypothetical protein